MYEEYKGYTRNNEIVNSLGREGVSTFLIEPRYEHSNNGPPRRILNVSDPLQCDAILEYKSVLKHHGWSLFDCFRGIPGAHKMSAQEHEREYQLMVKTIPASYDYGQGLPPDNMIHILHDTFSGDRERWTRPLSLPVGDIHPVQHISVFLETGVPTNCRFALPYGAGPARDAFYRLKTLHRCKICGASSIRPFTAKHESTKDHLGAVAIQFKEQNGSVSLHDLFRKTIGIVCESVFISHIIRYEGCYKINNLYMVNSQLAGIIDTWLKSGVQGDDPYRYGYRSRGLEFSVLAKSLKDAGVKKKRSNLAGICCKCSEPGVADYLVKTISATMEFCRKHGELLEVVLDKMDEMEAIK